MVVAIYFLQDPHSLLVPEVSKESAGTDAATSGIYEIASRNSGVASCTALSVKQSFETTEDLEMTSPKALYSTKITIFEVKYTYLHSQKK